MSEPGRALLRTRWAAIGAAVAVTLGAGGIGLVDASIDSDDKPVTVTVSSERPLDTRIDLGLSGPFLTNTPRDLQITGPVTVAVSGGGTTTKTVVPKGATSVLVNITAVFPTDAGHISLRPAGSTGIPTGSNLNFGPGDVVPNAATVALSPDGAMQIWLFTNNPAGTTHVVLDIVGYTIDHTHDDRYYTKDEVDALLAGKADAPTGSSTLTLPSAAFAPISSMSEADPTTGVPVRQTFWEIAYHAWGRDTFQDDCVVAPVFLPDGATITEMKVRYFTGDVTSVGETTLGRYEKSTQNVSTMATRSNDAIAGSNSQLVSTTTITNPVVSDAFTYAVQTCLDTSDVYMDYVEIIYTNP